MGSNPILEQEVAAIGDLSRDELVQRWISTYGCPPPKRIGRSLLARSAAWHLQAKHMQASHMQAGRMQVSHMQGSPEQGSHLGDLYSASTAMLRGAAHKADARVKPIALSQDPRTEVQVPVTANRSGVQVSEPLRAGRAASPRAAAGSRLFREWKGRMHVVDVTDDGFVFDGRTYRSLSAIARHITGAHWSGPRFFAP